MPTNNATIVENKVKTLITNKEMFTSVDISNAIKEDGIWIRCREVASVLRQHDFSMDDYARTSITVANGRQASLYHPDYADPSNYTKTNQRTIAKSEVDKKNPATLVVPASVPTQTTVHTRSVCKRFRIPKKLVEAIGLKAGDKVDTTKFDASLFSKISDKLIVTKDGRINIMANSLQPIVKNSNVSVYESNGKIYLK
jgi:hypothetical protein